MGGDTFEGVQKLTNQEYEDIVQEILHTAKALYRRAETYPALPEKTMHGDVDFLIILNEDVTIPQFIQALQIQQFKLSKNLVNSVYKNKQVDFTFVPTDQQFEMRRAYHAYSGIGGYLGMFFPSKLIRLRDTGLYALAFQKNYKFQFLISQNPAEIFQFYGLSYEKYKEGFKSRLQVFEFLQNSRFLDEQHYVNKQLKIGCGKLSILFKEHLRLTGPKPVNPDKYVQFGNPLEQTLQYFKLDNQFNFQFNKYAETLARHQQLNKKFNATHLMSEFKIPAKDIDALKLRYRSSFGSLQQYFSFVQQNSVSAILDDFSGKILQTEQIDQSEIKNQKQQQMKIEQNID